MSYDLAKELTHSALVRWNTFEWTTQGFGMIRTYLDTAKRWRLNIWDDRLMVPNVSLIHDHPWSFTSYVIAGELTNRRYGVRETAPARGEDATHHWHHIITGEGGGKHSPVHDCLLIKHKKEVYGPSSIYSQSLDEVHKTNYTRGTVTINDRTPATKDHTARVFWPVGTEWVDAEPRIARSDEVNAAVGAALEAIGCIL